MAHKADTVKTKPLTTSQKQEKINESVEILDAIGQRSEKRGIYWTKYFMDLWDEENKRKSDKKKSRLEDASKYKKMEYHRILAGMIQEESQDLDLPVGYSAWAEFSSDGVIVKLKDRWGNDHYRAFKPEGIAEIDFNAVVTLLVNTMDTADKLEAEARSNLEKQGIVLP